ncbi:MAG: restriction endonuclease [Planctomycetes bacterium]|nr:restriction endonuclease [Planctomycetota bacterium]
MIYRSRSAMQALYEVAEVTEGEPSRSRWFEFEREVKALMEVEGFEVQHVAASRSGDGGVDVYATKGSDLDEVCWVIQCKYLSKGKKVGPDKVRELVGTIQSYPRGTRGLIVTTTSFTPGAVTLAEESGIRLMEGAEFRCRSRIQK